LTRLVQYVGSVLIIIGVLAVVAIMGSLGFRRSFGQAVNVLRNTGLYKVTRNPQIVAGSLIVLGVVLRWPSWYAAGWVFLFAVIAHLMVMTEEEHLRAVFGEAYVDYCWRVPRYLRLRRRRNGAAA
jgi:protein-S-isoprenylcysteine O-methyltransferase Ste14